MLSFLSPPTITSSVVTLSALHGSRYLWMVSKVEGFTPRNCKLMFLTPQIPLTAKVLTRNSYLSTMYERTRAMMS